MTKEDLIISKLQDLASDVKDIRSEQKILNEKLIRFDCCLQNIVDKSKEKQGLIDHVKKATVVVPISIVTSILITILTLFLK